MKIHEVLAGIGVGALTVFSFYDTVRQISAPVSLDNLDFGAAPPIPFLQLIALAGVAFLFWLVYPKDEVPA